MWELDCEEDWAPKHEHVLHLLILHSRAWVSRILRTCSRADMSQLENIVYSTRPTSQRFYSKPCPYDSWASVLEQTCCNYRAGTQRTYFITTEPEFSSMNCATTEFAFCSTWPGTTVLLLESTCTAINSLKLRRCIQALLILYFRVHPPYWHCTL